MALAETVEAVERLVTEAIPETDSLEYKSALDLNGQGARKELLKDLTGMGNGGGGVVIFGVAEAEDHDGRPEKVTPLVDRGVVGVLEDITRSSISPPLLMALRFLDHADGFLLIAEVSRSPLGPYRVDLGGENRYFTRTGSRTAPMSEQQVRDAYALAARGRDNRDEVWQRHGLPLLSQSGKPWLTVSAVPEEPLAEVFDPGSVSLEVFHPLSERRLPLQLSGLESATSSSYLSIWADGVHGDDKDNAGVPTALMRFHRDGSVGVGRLVTWSDKIPLLDVPRRLNGQLAYIAWLWEHFQPRTPIELVVKVQNLDKANIDLDGFDTKGVVTPLGVDVSTVVVETEVLPQQLAIASVRHRIVRQLSNRLYNAFGRTGTDLLFEQGWLHGADGKPLLIGVFGWAVFDNHGRVLGSVHGDGWVTTQQMVEVGHLSGGVILNKEGRVLAATEMAVGSSLPDTFLQTSNMDIINPGYPTNVPGPRDDGSPPPKGTGEWSDESLLLQLNPAPR